MTESVSSPADGTWDLVVIGGGPAGYVGALRAAQAGARVALIERERPGGTCLHWGCIPTKSLLRSAEVLRLFRQAPAFGLRADNISADFPAVVRRSRAISDRLTKGIELLFRKRGVTHLTGSGTLLGTGRIAFQPSSSPTQEIQARHVLLATGARLRALPMLPPDGHRVLTSREALVLEKPPASLLIIGAGAIGVEFASLFQAFGTEVTLVEKLTQILPSEDVEVAAELARHFTRAGIRIHTGAGVASASVEPDGVRVRLEGGDAPELRAECALVAVGLEPNLDGLLAPGVELTRDRGWVRTDERYQTSIPGVFAAGDLIGPPWLAHAASFEAVQAVEGIFLGKAPRRPSTIPGCVYGHPQVASVGLTEQRARELGLNFKVGKFPFFALGRALAAGDNAGFVKLLFAETDGRLLGAHIIGSEATEIIGELNLALALNATRDQILSAIHAHPTLSEAIAEAAASSTGEAVHG